MSCFWHHLWGKWTRHQRRISYYDRRTSTEIDGGIEDYQLRQCERCGKVQEELI